MTRRLPLGIDIGTSRLRVVAMRRERSGAVRVECVATRDFCCSGSDVEPEVITSGVADAVAEIGSRRRACVLALPWNSAAVRCAEFPPMRSSERLRAARLESALFSPWKDAETPTRVRVRAIDGTSAHLVVVAPVATIRDRMRVVTNAGLRVLAMDYEPFALGRAFPQADAILDVGSHRSRLYGKIAPSFRVLAIDGGGATLSAAIAAALSIDRDQAERRKRSIGASGACDEDLNAFVSRACVAIDALRERSVVRSLGITGNGSRIRGFLERVAAAASVTLDSFVHSGEGAQPLDAAFSYDCALASSLATWVCD